MDARLYILTAIVFVLLLVVLFAIFAVVRYVLAAGRRRREAAAQPESRKAAPVRPGAGSTVDAFPVESPIGAVEPVADRHTARVDEHAVPEVHPHGEVQRMETASAGVSTSAEPLPRVLEPELRPEPEPEPSPEPGPSLPLELTADSDAADSSRGDSLAEDLERLMASAAKPPLLTPAEHEVALAAPSAPLDEPEPVFGVTEPLAPTPSLGVALSSATPPLVEPPVPREAVPGVATNEAPADFDATPSADPDAAAQLASADTTPVSSLSVSEVLPVPSAQPQMSPPPSGHEPTAHPIEMLPIDGVPTYEMVAPVELSFTVGDGRVGVKAGTRTYGEFQRLASILLGDLRKARGW